MEQINSAINFETSPLNAEKPAIGFSPGMTLKEIEKNVILETLRHQKYNRTRTAKVLGIGIRTLQRKLKQYRELDETLDLGIPVVSA